MDDVFLRAIMGNQEDDGPRLVYADYLDEQGEFLKAEFWRWSKGLVPWECNWSDNKGSCHHWTQGELPEVMRLHVEGCPLKESWENLESAYLKAAKPDLETEMANKRYNAVRARDILPYRGRLAIQNLTHIFGSPLSTYHLNSGSGTISCPRKCQEGDDDEWPILFNLAEIPFWYWINADMVTHGESCWAPDERDIAYKIWYRLGMCPKCQTLVWHNLPCDTDDEQLRKSRIAKSRLTA